MQAPPQKTPKTPTDSQSSPHLSSQFFSKVPELNLIEEAFNLSTIDHQLTVRDLDSQFELLRAITETKKHKLRFRSNTVLENKKNRYPEQSIFEQSRVHLNSGIKISKKDESRQVKEKRKNTKSDYVNANFVFVPTEVSTQKESLGNIAIISQAPLQQTIQDFLSIIVENKIECVVMLCNVMENGKNRCYDYLNQTNLYESVESVPINSFFQAKKYPITGIEIRKIKIKYFEEQEDGESAAKYHQFHHILFTQWPDKSVPEKPELIQPVLDFSSRFSKVLIHCSAGLGRSGVVAALFKIIKGFDQQNNPNLSLSVFGTVRKMREDRYGAVQNNQQYKFIYQYIKFYLDNQKRGKNCVSQAI